MPDHDDERSARDLTRSIGDRTVASAESCTAGRVAQRLASIDGSGAWFRGGVVAYQTDMKRSLLGVSAPSVYSELAVQQMAEGVARLMAASVAVATSGVTGDEPMEGVAPGTVFIGCYADGVLRSHVVHLACTGDHACDAAGALAISLLAEHLERQGESER